MSTDIHIDGLSDLQRLWDRAPQIVEREMRTAVTEATELLEREIQERTPVWNSSLRKSISANEPLVLANQVIGVVGTSLGYVLPVEFGRKAAFTPITPLVDWAKTKLGKSEKEALSMAFAISRHKSKHKTPGHHMFRDAFKSNQDQVRKKFRLATQRILDALAGRGA